MGALELFARARDVARLTGNLYLAAIAGVSAVSGAARTGAPSQALDGYAELLDYFDRAGSRAQQWTTVRTLIETLTRLSRDEPAAVLYGALTASPTALPLIGADAVRIDEAVATLEARLGHDRFQQPSRAGQPWTTTPIAHARKATLDDHHVAEPQPPSDAPHSASSRQPRPTTRTTS